jgi:hypothetical protein
MSPIGLSVSRLEELQHTDAYEDASSLSVRLLPRRWTMSFPAESPTGRGEKSGAKRAGLRPGAGSRRRTGWTRTIAP